MDECKPARTPMNSARWEQIKNILADAVECKSDRASFVADSCRGDSLLQAEVEALLAHDDSTWCDDAFLLGLRAALLSVATGNMELAREPVRDR